MPLLTRALKSGRRNEQKTVEIFRLKFRTPELCRRLLCQHNFGGFRACFLGMDATRHRHHRRRQSIYDPIRQPLVRH